MQRFPVVYRGITHAGVIWTFSRIHDPLSNHLYVHGIYVHVNVLSTALLTEDTVKWTIKYCKRKMVWNKGRFRFPTSGRTSNTKREYQKIVPKKYQKWQQFYLHTTCRSLYILSDSGKWRIQHCLYRHQERGRCGRHWHTHQDLDIKQKTSITYIYTWRGFSR